MDLFDKLYTYKFFMLTILQFSAARNMIMIQGSEMSGMNSSNFYT